MKIIKAPQFDICECKKCGTIFQPDIYDELHYKFENLADFKVFARCPTCSDLVEVKTKEAPKMKGGE